MTIEINEQEIKKMIDDRLNAVIDKVVWDHAVKFVNNVVSAYIDEDCPLCDRMEYYIKKTVSDMVKERIEKEGIFTPEYMSNIQNSIAKTMAWRMAEDIKYSIGSHLLPETEEEEEY